MAHISGIDRTQMLLLPERSAGCSSGMHQVFVSMRLSVNLEIQPKNNVGFLVIFLIMVVSFDDCSADNLLIFRLKSPAFRLVNRLIFARNAGSSKSTF